MNDEALSIADNVIASIATRDTEVYVRPMNPEDLNAPIVIQLATFELTSPATGETTTCTVWHCAAPCCQL